MLYDASVRACKLRQWPKHVYELRHMYGLIARDYSVDPILFHHMGHQQAWRLEMGLDHLGYDVKKSLLPARYYGEECNVLTAV